MPDSLQRGWFAPIDPSYTTSQDYVSALEPICWDGQESLFELIIKQSSDVICLHSADGHYEFISDAVTNMLGYTAQELSGQALFAFMHPEDAERLRQTDLAQLIDHKKAVKSRYRVLHKKGYYLWVESQYRPITNTQGQIVKIFSVTVDISTMRHIEGLMIEMQRMANIGGWEYDVSTKSMRWTEQMFKIFELPVDFSLQALTTLVNHFDHNNRSVLRKVLVACIADKQPYDVELKITTAKQRSIWVRAMGKPVIQNNQVIKVTGCIQDIQSIKETERRLEEALEEAHTATEAKARFVSVMSHEIRTPLNAVTGMAHLLMQEGPRADQMEYLRSLHFSAENLLGLVNNILDFSKLEAGKVNIEHIGFNLFALANSIKESLQVKAQEKDLRFNVFCDPRVPDVVMGDPVRLSQILTNLLNNAIKFTSTGSVTLDIKYEGEYEYGVALKFEVIDTGIGIPAEKHEVIFDDFQQASNTTTRQFGGTGLGLAITRRLLLLLDSDIALESAVDQGSKFYFVLHMPEAEATTYNDNEAAYFNGMEAEKLAGTTVLLVEDNDMNVLVATRFLQKWGIVPDVAYNGKEALDKIQAKDYDLVLMDLQMPEMDGIQATKAIRKLRGERFQKMPIVALTASANRDTRQEVLNYGMNDFIAKPFHPQALYASIARLALSGTKA